MTASFDSENLTIGIESSVSPSLVLTETLMESSWVRLPRLCSMEIS